MRRCNHRTRIRTVAISFGMVVRMEMTYSITVSRSLLEERDCRLLSRVHQNCPLVLLHWRIAVDRDPMARSEPAVITNQHINSSKVIKRTETNRTLVVNPMLK